MDWLHLLLMIFGPIAGWLAHRLYAKLSFSGRWKINGRVRLRNPEEEIPAEIVLTPDKPHG